MSDKSKTKAQLLEEIQRLRECLEEAESRDTNLTKRVEDLDALNQTLHGVGP